MDFLSSLFQKKQTNTKDIAKDRLKLVLIHDRANYSTQVLEMLKSDIIKVISNYMEIDDEELDIQITKTPPDGENEAGLPVLYANIPIKNMRKVDKD